MNDKHTPAPWSINEWPQDGSDIAIGAPGTPRIAILPLRYVSINEQSANAKRIVACVNACDGIPTAALECQSKRKISEAWIKQRDDLMGALKQIAENVSMYHAETLEGIARAAIAKATGE